MDVLSDDGSQSAIRVQEDMWESRHPVSPEEAEEKLQAEQE